MNHKIKELQNLITVLRNEEGLSEHGETLLEGYSIGLESELAKSNNVIPPVSYRFDVPNDVVGCAYYSDDAYYDQESYYMIDQDGNKVRPDEKYLVVK